MLVDHFTLAVSDLARSRRFYEAAMPPLGITVMAAQANFVGFSAGGSDEFYINQAAGPVRPSPETHFAFLASSRDAVDRFHASGVAAGGRDDGPPGLRPQYHAGYYAAFLLDPDGYRIEAVFHDRSVK